MFHHQSKASGGVKIGAGDLECFLLLETTAIPRNQKHPTIVQDFSCLNFIFLSNKFEVTDQQRKDSGFVYPVENFITPAGIQPLIDPLNPFGLPNMMMINKYNQ